MNKEQIGLLDCNNFFVSCERLFRPDLWGKPVLVLSSNDGCVVARSQEVKDMGVSMGVPYFSIKDIVKKHGITTFSSHFALYRDISRRVFTVMEEELDRVEQYSIDEAFFVAKGDPSTIKKEAERLRNLIQKRVGIPVSIGMADNKTQAKYANQLAKKSGGVCHLTTEDWQSKLDQIKLSDIWGVGGQMAMKLHQKNLNFASDLLAWSEDVTKAHFGKNGVDLRRELMGEQAPLTAKREQPKSIMSSRSFKDALTSKDAVADAVAYHVRHVAKELRTKGLKTNVIRVSIGASRHGDFVLRGGSQEAVLTTASNDSMELLKAAQSLLLELFEPGVPYKKAGVSVGNLVSEDVSQEQLFATNSTRSSAELMQTIDGLNQKAGRELVVLSGYLKNSSWQSKSASKSPAYTTNWSQLAVAKSK